MSVPLNLDIFRRKLGGSQGPILGANGSRKYTIVWVLKTPTILSGPTLRTIVQAGAAKVPEIGDPFQDGDPSAVCTDVRFIRSDENELVWDIEADYTTNPAQDPDQGQAPLDRPSRLAWSFREYEEALLVDTLGKPYANTLDDPLEEPFLTPRTNAVLTITRNELSFNAGLAISLANKVNNAEWLGGTIATVKADAPVASEQYEEGQSFWQITYRFEYQPAGWNPVKILNVGRRRRLVAGGSITAVPDDNGVLLNGLALLNEAGIITDRDNPHFIQFFPFETTNFTIFNLP